MKVLIFNDSYGALAGAETYFFHLGALLRKKGFDVYLGGFGKVHQRTSHEYIYKETKFWLFRFFWRLTFNPFVYFSLNQWIRKVDPDVIHLCNINKYTFALLLACRGRVVVHSVLDYGLICPSKWAVYKDTLRPCVHAPFRRLLDKTCLPWYYYYPMAFFIMIRKFILQKLVKMYIVESPALDEYIRLHGYKPITLATLGMDLNDWTFAQKTDYSNRILFVGLLEENKGVKHIIPIMKELLKKKPDIKLDIIGDGAFFKYLEHDIKENKLESNVKLLGRIKTSDLKPFYQGADLLIVPSIWMDNAPLVVMQSMACGTPIVAYRRGGLPWQIGETGIVIDDLRPTSFVDGIERMYNEPDHWKRCSKKSNQRACELFDSNVNIAKFEKLYKSSIG